jgi:hypothetical protein
MIEFLKNLMQKMLVSTPIAESETHYLLEIFDEDGILQMWIEKEKSGFKEEL